MNNLNAQSVVVGVDVHKFSHTAVALNAWGQERGAVDFSNDSLVEYTSWLRSLGPQDNIIVALEDANCYGVHLVEHLNQEGFRIRYVPAILTERERKQSTKRHKSDYIDAKRVGRVILTKYEETLPAKENIASPEELRLAQNLDLLLMERRDLVKAKTLLKNQLHALLHQYYGDHYGDRFKKVFQPEAMSFFEADLLGNPNPVKQILAAGIVRRLRRLTLTEAQIQEISKDIARVSNDAASVQLLAQEIHGCGILTAASILAEVITIKRFPNKEKFAMYAGAAPREHSSGRHDRLYTNPFGNRRLNRALHTVALTQIAVKGNPAGKLYYQRKLSEGKTKLWALRCLKRQIANRIFQVLRQSS